MGADHAFEIDRVLRHAGFRLQVAVIDRQRKVRQRDAGDFGARLRQFMRHCAASLALSEPERSDPGITRIFSADIF